MSDYSDKELEFFSEDEEDNSDNDEEQRLDELDRARDINNG
jgi:hypothetical protein